jgi:hypothetical protein
LRFLQIPPEIIQKPLDVERFIQRLDEIFRRTGGESINPEVSP